MSDVHGSLVAALRTAPIPSTPVVQLRHVEERGLALLDLGSRLDHVVRQSEHLTLVNKDNLSRRVSMDVDLSALAERHFFALSQGPGHVMGTRWSKRHILDERPATEDGASHDQLWVPITNQTRTDLAQVVVRDANDAVLPRMSSPDVLASYAAGLVKLFRMQLESFPDLTESLNASNSDLEDPIARIRSASHRSRWLLESVIHRLAIEGFPSGKRITTTSAGVDDEAAKIRDDAVSALDAMLVGQALSMHAFFDLLEFTANNYPVLVLVPRTTAPFYVYFDGAPISVENSFNEKMSSRQRFLNASSPVRVFTVEYESLVARGTSSYHVSLQVDERLRVRRFTASSDADVRFVETLTSDMLGVASRYDQLKAAGHKLLENELQSISARIADLVLRRTHDANQYRAYLHKLGADADADAPDQPVSCQELVRALYMEAERPLRALEAFATAYAQGALTQLVDVLTAEVLTRSAKRLRDLALDRDLMVDNDPREHGAHIYWHRRMVNRDHFEPVRVRVSAVLVDDPPSLDRSVWRMLIALIGVMWLTFSLMFHQITWPLPGGDVSAEVPQADALVTVLLLVPGLLLTRLDIPETNSVLGQIRLQSRLLAYLSFAVLTVSAIYVATSNPIEAWLPRVLLLALILLAGLNAVAATMTRAHGLSTASRSRWLPEWVRREFGCRIATRLAPRPVTFVSTQVG